MSLELQRFLAIGAILGCGTMGGVFFAFSTFVMKALGRLPSVTAVAAMQFINLTVVGPWFVGVFLGTAGVCVLLAIGALRSWPAAYSLWLLAGSLVYLTGVLGLTMMYHVPRNSELATLAAHDPGAAGFWSGYLADWTRWNHVRTAAALASAGLFVAGLCRTYSHATP